MIVYCEIDEELCAKVANSITELPLFQGNEAQLSVTVSQYEMQCKRPYMEDRSVVSCQSRLAGVIDGHSGDGVAIELKRQFVPNFSKLLNNLVEPLNSSEITSGMDTVLRNIDEYVFKIRSLDTVGSTATISYIHLDPEQNCFKPSIITANVGDSRVVLSQNKIAINLTTDHKPYLPSERARILNLGGRIDFFGGTARVVGYYPNSSVQCGLAMSRAIGDKHLKPFVCCDPQFQEHFITPQDEFIIVASDGLWDMFTSQQAVDFVHKMLNDIGQSENGENNCNNNRHTREFQLDNIAKCLAEESYRRDIAYSDNISIIIQWLHHG